MPEPQAGTQPQRTFGDKIELLLDAVRPEDGTRRYTGKEVVEGVNALGFTLSASHFSELRRDLKNANPTVQVMNGLGAFFKIRPTYFQDDVQVEAEVEAELELRVAMRNARVLDLALRAQAELEPNELIALQRMLTEAIRDHADD